MPIRCFLLLIVVAPFALENEAAADFFSVGASHNCSAYNGIDGDSVSFTAPASPFSNAHTIQFGDWNCSSNHSGIFDSEQGMFEMTDTLQARDFGDYTYALSSGGFNIRTSSNILVTYKGTMSYALPGNSSDASLTFHADRYDFPSGNVTTLWSDYDGLVAIDPATGNANISGSFYLPAITGDSFYFLSLGMNLYTSGDPGPSGDILTAGGTMEVTYAVVPEPATLLCMVVPLAILRRNLPR